MQLISVSLHDLQSRWLPARQTGSSTRKKVLLRIMLRDTTVCEDDLVKQALRHTPAERCLRTDAGISDAFGSSILKAFRPVHSSKLHHSFSRLSLPAIQSRVSGQHRESMAAAFKSTG